MNVALLQVGGKLVWGKPKSRAGERVVGLDKDSVAEGKAHRTAAPRERLAAGEAWQDSGGCSPTSSARRCTPSGSRAGSRPLAKEAGLPVIKFHAARHTAATLALEAGIDIKVVTEPLGHSTTRITQDLYQHVRFRCSQDAAETVVALLPEP